MIIVQFFFSHGDAGETELPRQRQLDLRVGGGKTSLVTSSREAVVVVVTLFGSIVPLFLS